MIKVLIVADEVWNDSIHGNNVLSNWFEGFPAEFAEIYCSPGIPENKCCKNYFQVTDKMMVRSLLCGQKAGQEIKYDKLRNDNCDNEKIEIVNSKWYLFLKSITTESLRLCREIVWSIGRYDISLLTKFIQEFNPDVIFCPRYSTLKLLRLEKIVMNIAKKPIIAFTGDDEFSLQQIRFSLFYWIRRFAIRQIMKKQIPQYDMYYCHSKRQAKDYKKIFNVDTEILMKCGEFREEKVHCSVGSPIRIIYAGKLYCNRWKTLALIGEVLKEINQNGCKIVLDIYTRDKISKSQERKLNDGINIILKGGVSPKELEKIYEQADIALHVESFDLKNALLTQYSFSTKIIDCMSSGCAVMAVCDKKQTGYQYLKENEMAFVASNKAELKVMLNSIALNPSEISRCAVKVYQKGKMVHEKSKVQLQLMKGFQRSIKGTANT